MYVCFTENILSFINYKHVIFHFNLAEQMYATLILLTFWRILGPDDSAGSSGASDADPSESDRASEHTDEEEAIKHEDEPPVDVVDPFADVGDLILEEVHVDPVPAVIPPEPVVVAPPPAHPPAPDPVLEHMAGVKPPWGIGVESAEVNRHAKTLCYFCKGNIDKGLVRLRYNQFKSQSKFMHATCTDAIPIARLAQSKACLRYQRDFGLGAHADAAVIRDELDRILAVM